MVLGQNTGHHSDVSNYVVINNIITGLGHNIIALSILLRQITCFHFLLLCLVLLCALFTQEF